MVTKTPTYRVPPDSSGQDTNGVILVDPATGEGYKAGSGSGGSLSAKANAALQTSTEAATTDPLSMDLSRRLRTTDDQVLAALNTPATSIPPGVLLTTNDLTPFVLNTTSNTDITLAAAGGGVLKNRAYVAEFTVTGAATTILIYNDASAAPGTVVDRFDVPAGGGVFSRTFNSRPWWTSAANKPLIMKQSGGAQISGVVLLGPAAA